MFKTHLLLRLSHQPTHLPSRDYQTFFLLAAYQDQISKNRINTRQHALIFSLA